MHISQLFQVFPSFRGRKKNLSCSFSFNAEAASVAMVEVITTTASRRPTCTACRARSQATVYKRTLKLRAPNPDQFVQLFKWPVRLLIRFEPLGLSFF